MSKKFVGIEVGGTKIQIFLTDDKVRVLERYKFFVKERKEASYIRDEIQLRIGDILSGHKVSCIGVGYGGPVSYPSGHIVRSYHVQGWTDFHLGKWLEGLSNCLVVVDNDANVAALGEACHGIGKGLSPVLYITMGSGVGAGLVIEGEVYHGFKPGDMEIGHIRLDKSGRIVEDSCSGWAVDRKIRKCLQETPGTILAGLVGDTKSGEAKYLSQAIDEGDPGAREILEETADDFAFALSHAVHLTHPEIIVLGGGLSLIGEPLRDAVQNRLGSYLMDAIAPPKIHIAELREDVVCVGAAQMAYNYFEKQ